MYEKSYTLRYGDIDQNKDIRCSAVLDILQDISTRHSMEIGYGMEKLFEMRIAFLLKGWRVALKEPVVYGSDIVAKTGIMKIRHFETVRKYELWQDSRLKIIATGSWMPVNIDSKRIITCPEEIKNGYDNVNEEDNNFPFERIRTEENARLIDSYKVQKRDIDTNGHMNNVKSAELAFDMVEGAKSCSQLKVMYMKEIYQDDMLDIYEAFNFKHIELRNKDNQTCVIIEAE